MKEAVIYISEDSHQPIGTAFEFKARIKNEVYGVSIPQNDLIFPDPINQGIVMITATLNYIETYGVDEFNQMIADPMHIQLHASHKTYEVINLIV